MAVSDPKFFKSVLQTSVLPDDREWCFKLPDLPSASVSNANGLIKSVSVISNSSKQTILLRLVSHRANRAIDNNILDRFISISFGDFRLQYPPLENDTRLGNNDPQPAPAKESADYIFRMLKAGVSINGVLYSFYGHSNSQLKSKSCFLYAGTKEEAARRIECMGDFSKIRTVAKMVKRIGLIFSTANVAVQLPPNRCEDIPDVRKDDYIFTDGCGLISPQLAKRLVQLLNIRFRAARYTPSVFQIRYRGYKGVVTLDPRLRGQVQVQFRESMKKINVGTDMSFAVVEYSKPYAFGFLNDEVVVLLHALGIPQSTFIRKQHEHLEFLGTALHDAHMAFRFLSFINEPDLAEKVLLQGLEPIKSSVRSLVSKEFDKMLSKRDEQRCRILIPYSRLIFGVCDPYNILKDGECAIRMTMAGDGVAKTIINTEVLVTRNPCLHPGDLQKFKAVQHQELSHLVDCIVFPTRGRRPSADMMSGGDLDGDKFFVCWDSDLIPSTVAQPAAYQSGKEPIAFQKITHDDRLAFFARYTNASLGRAKSLHTDWARLKGPMSAECQELNYLYSSCVDGNRIKIPPHLESVPKPANEVGHFILDIVHQEAQATVSGLKLEEEVDVLSLQGLDSFLSRDDAAFSEFDLFKMTAIWCAHNGALLKSYLEYFDFDQMSDEERAWALAQMPAEEDTASLIMNALLRSHLISQAELGHFRLDEPRMKWKCLFDSRVDRLERLLDVFGKGMELFHRKFLVLRIDTRLTIALYIPRKVSKYHECIVDDTVRLFSFPHSDNGMTNYRRTLPTKVDYRLYFDDSGLQLYEKQRANTWVYINKPGFDDALYKRIEGRGDRRRAKHASVEMGSNNDLIISVALNKFSANLVRHIGRVNRNPILSAELYVISNRDVRSLQALDQWLEMIDTKETLPLFDKTQFEYKLPTLNDVDWSTTSKTIQEIAQRKNLASLNRLTSSSILEIFEWLLSHDQKPTLYMAYTYLLLPTTMAARRDQLVSTMTAMVDFLVKAPTLVIPFAQLKSWQDLIEPVRVLLQARAPDLLKALACAANTMQILVVEPYRNLLSQTPHMSLSSFGSLVEHISLVVRSPEVALDLMMGCLELESARLLSTRPMLATYFTRNCIGVAMEHINEAAESRSFREDLLELRLDAMTGFVNARLRIDSHSLGKFATNDHVQLTASTLPTNSLEVKPYSMDAIVEKSEPGCVTFRCLHPPPVYFESCSWRVKHCGSFVTSKAMFDALNDLAISSELSCPIYEQLLCIGAKFHEKNMDLTGINIPPGDLNRSQNEAITTAMRSALTCIWGPPGTGKTHTIAIILELLSRNPKRRILVAAPTHNAVDNVMRKFLSNLALSGSLEHNSVRVSTDVRKVAEDLRKYTCDAMLGKDLNENPAGRRRAQKQIKECRLIFTTCIGAGLGLLRSEMFDTVVVDEASQQTEPQTLVPLTKGCSKAILVGDHVQLGATVSPHAEALGFEQSLFERLYRSPDSEGRFCKVMLDMQYRMQASICGFSSAEFYEGRLKTAVQEDDRPLLPSSFPWPSIVDGKRERVFFVQCNAPEDLGRRSKSNAGQAALTQQICKGLQTVTGHATDLTLPSVAVLAPYARQVELLKGLQTSPVQVNSIDGFQGREADVVVFVTTRCNPHCEIGFLKDLRRLNVVMTRAKSACIIIGDRATLTGGDKTEKATQMWTRLLDSLTQFIFGAA